MVADNTTTKKLVHRRKSSTPANFTTYKECTEERGMPRISKSSNAEKGKHKSRSKCNAPTQARPTGSSLSQGTKALAQLFCPKPCGRGISEPRCLLEGARACKTRAHPEPPRWGGGGFGGGTPRRRICTGTGSPNRRDCCGCGPWMAARRLFVDVHAIRRLCRDALGPGGSYVSIKLALSRPRWGCHPVAERGRSKES